MKTIKMELTAKANSEFVKTLSLLLKGETSFSLMEAENNLFLELGALGSQLLLIKKHFRGVTTEPASALAELRLTAANLELKVGFDWEDFTGTKFLGFDMVRVFNQHTAITLHTNGLHPRATIMWNRGYDPIVTFRFDDETWSTLKEEFEEHSQMLEAFGN